MTQRKYYDAHRLTRFTHVSCHPLSRPFYDDNQTKLFLKIKRGDFKFHPEYWGKISEEAKVPTVTVLYQLKFIS
jgi:hypothetical protein